MGILTAMPCSVCPQVYATLRVGGRRFLSVCATAVRPAGVARTAKRKRCPPGHHEFASMMAIAALVQ